MNQTNNWNQIISFYFPPCILLLGLLTRFVLLSLIFQNNISQFDKFKESLYVLRSGNLLNGIFANHGFELFTLIYGIMVVYYFNTIRSTIFTNERYENDNITSNNRSSAEQHDLNDFDPQNLNVDKLKKIPLRTFVLRYIIIMVSLVFLLLLKQVINSSTSGILISGHFMALMTYSLSVRLHMNSTLLISRPDESNFNRLLLKVCWVLIGIWWFLLFITSAFYHTVLEKLIGVILGYFPTFIGFMFI